MKILTVVKKTGYNFIRHYLPYFPPGSKTAHNAKSAFRLIPKFDVILFEWANDLTASIINSELFRELQSKHQFKVVVRIHDHEVTKIYPFGRRIDHINWNRVDKIWFINPLIQKQFHELKGDGNNSFFISNAVDCNLFPESQADTKKVGLISLYFRKRKRIDRIVEVAKLLPDWEFHIRVHIPPAAANSEYWNEWQKFLKLAKGVDNIYWEHRDTPRTEKQQYEPDDLIEWYRDKAVIISTSEHEGFSYALGESAASGCMPVCWNWPGAETFWEPFVVSNAVDAAEMIANYKPSNKWRRYVLDYFNPEVLVKRVLEEIEK
jgi:glycosyltransferase involved in cell wall biosynthesis